MEKIPLKMVSARQAHSLEREIDDWREGCVLSYKWCFACNLKGQQEFPGPFDPCDNLLYIFLNILQRATHFSPWGLCRLSHHGYTSEETHLRNKLKVSIQE